LTIATSVNKYITLINNIKHKKEEKTDKQTNKHAYANKQQTVKSYSTSNSNSNNKGIFVKRCSN